MELIHWRISLNGRFLHNRCVYSDSVFRRLLGSTSATQRYKVRPYCMKTHEVMVSYEGTVQVLHWQNSTRWLIPPQRLHRIQFCLMEVVGLVSSYVMVYGLSLSHVNSGSHGELWRYYPGGFSLNGRFLHNRCTDSNSVCWRLLGSSLATQRYKVRLYRMKTQEVMVSCGTNTLADFT